jgi:hypothetical protein
MRRISDAMNNIVAPRKTSSDVRRMLLAVAGEASGAGATVAVMRSSNACKNRHFSVAFGAVQW